jgi:SAM-dependent methyltransferase
MSASFLSDPTPYASYQNTAVVSTARLIPLPAPADKAGWVQGVARRWQRERRRRKVGRAYDMALEIARLLPLSSSVLDVGCGNGYIAHHLSALLGTRVLAMDVNEAVEAPVEFRRFNGREFPVADQSFDAALFCYVLHHAQNLETLMSELRRVLRDGGWAVVYEDIPARWWDRIVCRVHDLKWRKRTGPCSFKSEYVWRETFAGNGFEVVKEKKLSRWRNLAHPVSRRLFVLRRGNTVPSPVAR